MAPTIRTCSLALALLLLASPGAARVEIMRPHGPTTFVGARAAELVGDPRRAALLYAALAEAEPGNRIIANRAISQAIAAGDAKLALQLMSSRSAAQLGVDGRLLLVADRLAAGKDAHALSMLRQESAIGDLSFLAPVVSAWIVAERRDGRALDHLAAVPAGSAIASYLPEQRALLLLRLKRGQEAAALAPAAIAAAGGRETRVRVALADGFMRLGDRGRALAMLQGTDPALSGPRARVEAGKRPGAGVETAAQAFSELLTALAIDLSRSDIRTLPIAMAQVARHASPANPAAPVLLGVLLADDGRTDDALAVLRSVSDGLLAGQARDVETRALIRAGRLEEALARAQAFVSRPEAAPVDWARLGDVLDEMGRYGPAADAFGRAVALVQAGGTGAQLWQLQLLRGAMLEQANRWPEARAALQEAKRLAPDNPLVLNYLGYAQLERGENLDAAEALIAEASRRAPNDASITDSLGWAQFKRGKVEAAIATLQRAAVTDPAQAEIHEHLGDALYTAGRKFEARHAWNAALITAEDDVKARIEAKINGGLKPGNAAP